MDGAGLEAEMMFKAGGDMVVVMGQAHDASIIEQVKMAKRYGKQVMCDVMLCPDKPGRAKDAQDMGVDYIIVHTGFDERNMIPGSQPARRSAGCAGSGGYSGAGSWRLECATGDSNAADWRGNRRLRRASGDQRTGV